MTQTQKLAKQIFLFAQGEVKMQKCWEIAKNSILIKNKLSK